MSGEEKAPPISFIKHTGKELNDLIEDYDSKHLIYKACPKCFKKTVELQISTQTKKEETKIVQQCSKCGILPNIMVKYCACHRVMIQVIFKNKITLEEMIFNMCPPCNVFDDGRIMYANEKENFDFW